MKSFNMSKRVTSASSCVSFANNADTTEFTIDHIYDVRSAVVCLLDAVASFIESSAVSAPESYISIAQQIFSLDEKLFKGVRDRYLWWSSAFGDSNNFSKLSRKLVHSAKPSIQTTSQHGFAMKYSRVEADRFLQCLLVGFEACREVLLFNLKRKSEKEANLFQQVLTLTAELQELETNLQLTTSKLEDAKRGKSFWINKNEELCEKLSAAEKKITELQKLENVLKWQKYADEINTQHLDEMKELKEKFDIKQKELVKTKENLSNKIRKLEAKLKKFQLRNEVSLTQPSTSMIEKLDHTKQQLYLRDQEIHNLRKHLLEQQKNVVGCMHGLQEDFKYLLDKLDRSNPGKAFNPDPDFVQFQAKLRLLHDACLNGSLSNATSSLPSQYKATEIKCVPVFKNRKPISLLPLPSNSEFASTSFKPRSVSAFAKSTPTPSGEVFKPSHPQLINPITGRANFHQLMKHFPYLTVEQVSQQWENFRKYDKNKDLCLDLPELYEVITDVCGVKVTVSEMKEAMIEIDRDQSNNVDFYEYLKIAEMIIRKQGRTAIFHSRDVTASQACKVQ